LTVISRAASSIIDVVKFGRDVARLTDQDATVITFGRTLLREHRLSSELWQQMVDYFGLQHTVDILTIMGNYIRVGIMLNAVDQHLAATARSVVAAARTIKKAAAGHRCRPTPFRKNRDEVRLAAARGPAECSGHLRHHLAGLAGRSGLLAASERASGID
jgi:hypothetical protein